MSIVVTDEKAQENIAANVRRLLELRGWSQQDLANATGESKMTISRIYRGKNMPKAGLLARIAEALDVNTDRLISDPPELVSEKLSRSA